MAGIELTDEQRAIQAKVRAFAREELAPVARAIDEADVYPTELVKRIAELGVLALEMPPEWTTGVDGLGRGDAVGGTLACEELAWASAAVGNIVSALRITGWTMNRYGSKGVKRDWLAPQIQGERIVAFAVTEPEAGPSSIRSAVTPSAPTPRSS